MTASTDIAGMLISLPDIALLAAVQRPVASMWRRRPAQIGGPFPPAVIKEGRQELFDAAAVVEWLEATGRGNNRNARADLAAFAALREAPLSDPTVLAGVTGLLCLIAISGQVPEGADELLDLADEHDPDDEYLYAEVQALGDRLEPLARYGSLLASAAYSPEAAFEKLMAERFRLPLEGHARTDLVSSARELVVSIALALGTQAELGDAVFVDPNGGSDLIIDLARRAADSGDVSVATPNSDTFAGRLARRRLRVHGILRQPLEGDIQTGFRFPERAVIVAQFPPTDQPAMPDIDVLRAIDEIALSCTAGQRVVIIGPASALTDRALPEGLGPGRPPTELDLASEITLVRRDIIRMDLVRAIVRLPAGLMTSQPRERLALWCLGPRPEPAVDQGSRTRGSRILVADLANVTLDAATIDALVADLVAGMYGRWGTAAHALQLTETVASSVLQLSGDDLVSPLVHSRRRELVTETVETLDAASAALRAAAHKFEPPVFTPRQAANHPAVTTIDAALERRLITLRSGLRLDEADVSSPTGVRVVGPRELSDGFRRSERRIESLVLAAKYPSSRLTEPGDVVFCTAPRPLAWVDRDGASVAVFPARVLRCTDRHLVPPVVAEDINAQPRHAKAWRAWTLRLVPPDQAVALTQATNEIALHRAYLLDQLQTLEKLATTLINGTASGVLCLTKVKGK
jgi:hypothetical protein